MRQAATGTMSFRMISLFRCAVEVIAEGDLLMRVEHHPSDLLRCRRFIGDSAGKSWCCSWGKKIIGKHRGMNPTDDDTVQSRYYFIRSTIHIIENYSERYIYIGI